MDGHKTAGMPHLSSDLLEERIGYRFKDRYLLQCALTHTSFANEQRIRNCEDYERLEFLGDAVLEMVSSAFLYTRYPGAKEGEMTRLRASLVCEAALAYCAKDFGLSDFIRLGKGEEAGGGRAKESIISDVCEALIGAIYLDSGGIECPREFIYRFILSDLENKRLFYDAKSKLQEYIQQQNGTIEYRLLEESGPGHMKHCVVSAVVNGEERTVGEGRSKKEAEQNAAFEVLKQIRDIS